MKLLGNIFWFILCGFWTGLAWFFLGLLLCITVIGIPFGVQCFKFAKISFFPFGKDIKIQYEKHPIVNLLWLLFFGWEMALGYLISGITLCITIIGIPFGIQAFKFMKLAVFPFGADIVETK